MVGIVDVAMTNNDEEAGGGHGEAVSVSYSISERAAEICEID